MRTAVYDRLRAEVLRRIERERLDPMEDTERVTHVATETVAGYQRSAHLGDSVALRNPGEMVQRLLASVQGYGALTGLLERNDVEEIFIEGAQVAYIDGSGRLHGLAVPTSSEENRQVVERLLAGSQRRLDATTPIVQARVLDGQVRLTAAIPPIAEDISATLRRHTLRRDTLRSLVDRQALSVEAAGFLWALAQTGSSVLVSGPPGAGKTSLLSALLASVPPTQCVRCCEEIRELQVPLAHGSFYETRPPGLDGSAEISLRDLVKFCLAMRPDVIVVGEVRGAEAFELTRAVNAGCGFACTIHANSARQALSALVHAAVMAGESVTERALRGVFAAAIDVVVHLDLVTLEGGGLQREVAEIIAVVPSLHDDFSTEPVFARERPGAPLRWTGALPPDVAAIDRRLPVGITVLDVCKGVSRPL